MLVSLVVVLALAVVPLASADSAVLNGYGTSGSTPVVEVKGTTTEPATADAAGLPFTGADLTVFVAAGIALTGVGLGMRRLARNKE